MKDMIDLIAGGWPESRVGAQRHWGKVWVVVQVDWRHTGGQDINHPHCYDTPIQPVLLVEGAVAHFGPIWRKFSLEREGERNSKRWCSLVKTRAVLFSVISFVHKLYKSQSKDIALNRIAFTFLHRKTFCALFTHIPVWLCIIRETFPCQASHRMCGGIQ